MVVALRVLRRSRLSGDPDAERARYPSRAAFRNLFDALLYHAQHGGVDAERLALHRSGGVEPRLQQFTTIRERCVDPHDLQRRHEHVALPDGVVDRVAAVPAFLDAALLPLGAGQRPGRFAGEVDAGLAPDAELLLRLHELAHAHLGGELVEVDVARIAQRVRDVLLAVAAALPAAEAAVAELEPAGAVDLRVPVSDFVFEYRGTGDDLEGRSRRVGARYCAVHHRPLDVVGQRGPFFVRYSPRQRVRVVGGRRVEASYRAVVNVHRDERAAELSHQLRRVALRRKVYRQRHVAALLRLYVADVAQPAPARIDLDDLFARRAAQHVLVLALDAVLAYHVAAAVELPVARFELLFRNFRDVADDVRRVLRGGVGALPDRRYEERLLEVAVHNHLRDLREGQVRRDGYRAVGRGVLFVDELAQPRLVHRDAAARQQRGGRLDVLVFL